MGYFDIYVTGKEARRTAETGEHRRLYISFSWGVCTPKDACCVVARPSVRFRRAVMGRLRSEAANGTGRRKEAIDRAEEEGEEAGEEEEEISRLRVQSSLRVK